MAKKDYKITINPNRIKVRDEKIKDMIATPGGVSRVFKDRKKAKKADKVGRKSKYKNNED
jgi:hypothetical protein